ncbi:4-carboxymuconolactone decarboxylase [Pseudohoeflea suaedae]|uniref:4-carboxymuconolactone decarboxylase n=1 Tax=Pseudohoeflea suaedae TaxID=877384 RepID=A0A4R5PN10_9HYPH|nr:carboxymuconolactone decarboxylase family protein [Pseudohoeflea suaedae]TDH38396.1 4-carboxymuconolactone decarboxylase [Pseudohoeflea suaedae]
MTDRRPEFQGEQFEKGLAIRREVLGSSYVDRSIAGADDVTAPLQKLLTEWCWGEIWGRPGLERKMRSVLNLGMLMALNRADEFKLHVRGALNNGLTREEIVEIILQGAIYCGAPASLDAMRSAKAIFAEFDAETEKG